MNWLVFGILMGLLVLNLIGLGVYHYNWHIDNPGKSWKCWQFGMWTIFLVICGVCYLILLGFESYKKWLYEKSVKK